MTISTFEAAKKICEYSDWTVSNLKLQKLLYIAHMFHIGETNGKPLINNFFEAWDYGPVVPELYREVKKYGSGAIRTGFFSVDDIDEGTEKKTIEEVCDHFLSVSPSRLVAMTHRKNGAWEKNYIPSFKGIIIPNEDILKEYEEL